MSKRICISLDEYAEDCLNEIKRFTNINTTSVLIRMIIVEKARLLRRANHEKETSKQPKS